MSGRNTPNGETPFASITRENLREIAKQGNQRKQWWIQKEFKLLPTNKDFLDLTEEQIDLIYENYLIDNPQIEQIAGEHFENPLYDQMEKNLETDVNKVLKGKDYYLDKDIKIEIKNVSIKKR